MYSTFILSRGCWLLGPEQRTRVLLMRWWLVSHYQWFETLFQRGVLKKLEPLGELIVSLHVRERALQSLLRTMLGLFSKNWSSLLISVRKAHTLVDGGRFMGTIVILMLAGIDVGGDLAIECHLLRCGEDWPFFLQGGMVFQHCMLKKCFPLTILFMSSCGFLMSKIFLLWETERFFPSTNQGHHSIGRIPLYFFNCDVLDGSYLVML